MSKNGNTYRYFIKLLVRGFEQPFCYIHVALLLRSARHAIQLPQISTITSPIAVMVNSVCAFPAGKCAT